ncbi:hypothetical protein GCM10011487_39520 [Steroidobacter agaridevorans]|uniref:DUF2780 domain-containing protein n=1 Tax=Steroidobacter agaridevorans TaxID=2695856 RepID=A0A829YGW3_9GAMM|nr:DUF2780 domain-containing protein [Steroidobacter agaridevorans]GFE81952.1 hypothetical protein GCM10011487_39520 [Steroidobacter agaridevorans]GFE85659.1 hypothetical protein GCM10011488_06130 [Steroidobacter agaridevorans]
MSRVPSKHIRGVQLVMLLALLACSITQEDALAATPGQNAVAYLQNQFGLTDVQARGAIGALLVYAREQLPQPQFNQLAARIPNADTIMQAVKLQGVVTRPLDDLSDYEESLASLGIGQPLAAQIAPAVVQFLGEAGFDEEQAILAGILR